MIVFDLKEKRDIKMLIALEGYTLRGFSREIGVSHSHLSQVLNGRKRPSAAIAKKISEGLNKDIREFFLIEVVDEQPVVRRIKDDPISN